MKKIGIIVALIILTFSFSVKAEVFAEMEIDCNNKNVTNTDKITCEGNLVYEDVTVEDIEFEYATNLDIEFLSESGFSLSKNGNKISIHANTPLSGAILDSTYVVKFTLKANSNNSEKESLTFKNIKINKVNPVSISDVSETFNVAVESTLDSDCFLNNISIDNVALSGFDKNNFEYKDIVVTKNVVSIDATRSSAKSSATGLGDVFIKPGETVEHNIEVTAEDKSQKTYKLFITNTSTSIETDEETNSIGMELSNDNTLKSIEVYNGKEKIPFTFNNKKDTFNIVIENIEIKTLTIKAVQNNNKATFVDKFGPRDVNVNYGDNKVLLKVQAENKDEKVYTLNITIKESRDNDNTLASLKINDEVVKLVEDVDTYEVTLSKEIEKTNIEALPNSLKAKVEFKDIDLVTGKNSVIIKVTAEDGTKKEYTINIIRSDKNALKEFKVEGYNIGFSKDQKEYVLKINQEDTKLKIIITPSNIEYEVFDNEELVDGSVVRVKIDDANGINEYKITILKDTNKISIIVYGIIILIAIAIVVLLIYMIRKKRNPKIDKDVDVI